ncbi:MAG: hypothetical protein RL318_3036 [Fibrobacterota bacterium]|jgi:regulator of sigma E protease
MNWIALLWQIPIGLAVLSLLVLVHELGHFIVARRTGTTVQTFSIGFGPALWKTVRNGIEYRISAIPFGGYVAMPGEETGKDAAPSDPNGYDKKSIGVRAAIAIAGPLVNIVFAFLLLWILAMVGVQEPARLHPVIAGVEPGSAAALGGLQGGDTLISIDGTVIRKAESALEHFALAKNRDVVVEVQRAASRLSLTIRPKAGPGKLSELGWAGLQLGGTVVVQSLVPDHPAQKAGLLPGDTLIAIGGVPLPAADLLPKIVNSLAGAPLQLQVGRPGARLDLEIKPKYNAAEKRWMLGLMPADVVTMVHHRYGPVAAAQRAGNECLNYASTIFRFLKALATRAVSPSNLAGPVGIIQMAGRVAHEGYQALFEFAAMLSINLGILNLMPLVITDGGRLLELAIEAVRGKPAPPKLMEYLTNGAFYLFLALALYVTFHDLGRIPMFLR